MSYIQKLFSKSIRELTLSDIQNHFTDNREESDIIEYKSYGNPQRGRNDHKEREKAILKTICAMLNSTGGVLIWGAPIEQKSTDGNKYFAGQLSPVDRLIKKDNFMAKIVNRIVPVASGINMEVIETGVNDKCIVIFEIEESNYKPHRFDDRYWMRLDGQSKVAPHHYVEALFNQVKYPNVEGYVKVNKIRKGDVGTNEDYFYLKNHDDKTPIRRNYYPFIFIQFEVIIINFSELINEEQLGVTLTCDKARISGWAYEESKHLYHNYGHKYINPNVKNILHYGDPLIVEHQIYIAEKDLEIEGNVLQVGLSFGGLKSPQKKSTYFIGVEGMESDDLQISFVEVLLNVPNHKTSSASKSRILTTLLGKQKFK